MTPEMQKKRDELAADYSREDLTVKEDFISGFNAAHDLMQEKVHVLVEALRFYADETTWDPDKFLVGSDPLRDDLDETEYSRFTPGKRAREALKGWE